jgi:hypothetical protein
MSKHLWRALAQVSEARPVSGRAERILFGTMRGGYNSIWVLASSDLIVLSEREGASRIIPVAAITGVVRPVDAVVRVLVGGPEVVALSSRSDEREGFAEAVALRANVPVGGVDGLFTDDGYAAFAGAVQRVAGYYLGGFRDTGAGEAVVLFDDAGVHLAMADVPWWQVLALPWAQVAEIVVEGYEETRQRVTLGRMIALGPLAIAVPKDENHSRAYLSIAPATGTWSFAPTGRRRRSCGCGSARRCGGRRAPASATVRSPTWRARSPGSASSTRAASSPPRSSPRPSASCSACEAAGPGPGQAEKPPSTTSVCPVT